MNKLTSLTVVFLLVIGVVMSGYAYDRTESVGFSISGGMMQPMSGGYLTSGTEVKDVLNGGLHMRLGIIYWISQAFALEGALGGSFMQFEEGHTMVMGMSIGENPMWLLTGITLNALYNIGYLIDTEDRFLLFGTVGAGIYPWRVQDDGFTGFAVRSPFNPRVKFSHNAAGFNAGAGLGYALSPRFTITGRSNYHHIFTAHGFKFGENFEDQGFLSFDLGVTYFLSSR